MSIPGAGIVVVMTGASGGFAGVTEVGMDDPQVVSPDEWLAARRQLLTREKEFTRQRDALNAERRRLPMTETGKQYAFEGRNGTASLLSLLCHDLPPANGSPPKRSSSRRITSLCRRPRSVPGWTGCAFDPRANSA